MNVEKYLKNLITAVPEYELSPIDKKVITFEGIEKFIFNKLNSSRYKVAAYPGDLQQKMQEKIHYCVGNKLPIHMSLPFGGYKKWQLPSAPLPDWAEVFNFVLLRDFLAPIAKAYKYGVILEYFSDEVFVARMNNYPQKDLDQYNKEFENIIAYLSKYLPKNMSVKTSKIRDQITQKEILSRFEAAIPEIKGVFVKLPKTEQEKMLKKTERNYQGDLSKLPAKKRYNILLDSTLVHEVFINSDWDTDVPWAFAKDMIAIGFRYTKSWGLHLRSSRGSAVQFWIGIGALQKQNRGYSPTILTYQQYLEALKEGKLKKEKIEIFKNKFKNLNEVFILTA